ncbi:MAG: hypothetical protein J6Y01_05815 [Spirochaetales bacterium]|nr:hypothetical protein [Spirochaetales bacterium]
MTTKCVDIEQHNCAMSKTFTVVRGGQKYGTNIDWIDMQHNCAFHLMSEEAHSVVEQVYKLPYQTLAGSEWALGIVTGDNRQRLHGNAVVGDEPIYTGKEIGLYTLSPPKKYIKFEPEHFQQVAPTEMYRAKEKLVYKFISTHPIFAYDDSGSLTLNSANILIPHISGMSVKTVMAFLNSDLFAFLYRTMFGEIKILQGNLCQLPFIRITPETDRYIAEMVDRIIAGEMCLHDELQNVIFELYRLNGQQREIVQKK